ncbi:MAG: hypothetical protein ACR2LJ_08585 [Acidimicrobiales bacterium]
MLDGYPAALARKLVGPRPRACDGHLVSFAIDATAANENAPSLAEVMAPLEAAGYTGQMAARPGGRLLCFTCRADSDVSEVAVEFLRRTEGASDPDDMLAIVALTCPRCGTRATVVLGYGPESGEDDAEVLLRLASPDKP